MLHVKEIQVTGEALCLQKRTSSKNMKFPNLFLFCGQHNGEFNPDPGPKQGLWIGIRIDLNPWIRIRIEKADPDPGGQK